MALRLTSKNFAALAQRGYAVRLTPAGVNAIRSYSSQNERAPASEKANSIINAFPGDSMVAKTGYFAGVTGLTALLISKEIYVVNEETLLVFAFGSILAVLYKAIKEPFKNWTDSHLATITDILTGARTEHKSAVLAQIEAQSQLKDIVQYTKSLFGMSKEIATMNAQAFELQQKVSLNNEIKTVLDSWVRYESSVRESEQKALADKVLGNVRSQLTNPKTQDEIIAQCIRDIQGIAKTA
ncbi:atp4 subunit B of the stator stalk of mitochondrial F1F0 ATP synthase [Coemansia sp. RSA 1813]|nr:atp4 subunit B of the stator stalk of mitochondrial F1F0 ATP synthase [Coemansia sp. RSA 1646]KAJ1766777.1 atp4 subunit B of the stator stalk of mitochondrial F1F0 ATP synthase [Coemansia sp. RSA 1843]KAJ2091822.1 atp4 subunit B of the stator stalk of mitochondrial F1F0 ATP synthase [Coemansia sp. RSA 986]KAJ2215852.1 atp4 subunit B of the stator stalk of mitochondrial F1F0 ATP synthase [Coemansia sp. RSA 487]KAJ2571782.1 atp4 subunit B of the stator stalk of mitochondrial F1F0 ATP synthase 